MLPLRLLLLLCVLHCVRRSTHLGGILRKIRYTTLNSSLASLHNRNLALGMAATLLSNKATLLNNKATLRNSKPIPSNSREVIQATRRLNSSPGTLPCSLRCTPVDPVALPRWMAATP